MKYELGVDGRDKAALEQMLDARTQGRLAMERREEESPPQNEIRWAALHKKSHWTREAVAARGATPNILG